MAAEDLDGVVIIDKPCGMTSHDVVARLRRVLGTRKVGHAGTLDPDASGVLVLGIGKATRLLTYLVADDKQYQTVIRLGQQTVTDDAAGEVIARATSEQIRAISDADIHEAATRFLGEIDQRPSNVSAVKVDGKRAYARVREGEDVVLPTRKVTISEFQIQEIVRHDDGIALTSVLTVSSGTFIRAVARDLGDVLGVGGHVESLRRTRSGRFTIADASELPVVGETVPIASLASALQASMSCVTATAEQAREISYGRAIALPADFVADADVCGVLSDTGQALAVATLKDNLLAPTVVFAAA